MTGGSVKASWLARAATVLAALSCYGTTAVVALLALLGISLAINEAVWAGAISIFAALATLALAASYRHHRNIGPTVVAALGLGLILWTMFGTYSRLVEIGGFGLLIAASLWDWRAIVSRRDLPDGVSWIEAGALGDRLERHPKPVIVDVRGPDEFTGPFGHIPEALNLPLDALSHDLTEIKALQERPVILVCRTDKRSATASALLRQAGFPDVRVLRGGMEQWSRTGLPVDSRAASGPA